MNLYEGGRIQEAACWAHVRRKFYDLHVAHASPVAAEAVERIGALYAIEKEIRGKPPDQRCAVRQTRAKPLLDQLRNWFEEQLHRLSGKSDVAAAKAERFIQTALREWAYARSYQNSDERRGQLDLWLHHYNFHRPHSSLKLNTPASRSSMNRNNLLSLHS